MNIGRRTFLKILGGVAALPLVRKTAWADRAATKVLSCKIVGPRDYVLGFPMTAVAAGATAEIAISPTVDFAPQRIVIPAEIAEAFWVVDLRVGKTSQLFTDVLPVRPDGSPTGLPAVIFSETAYGIDLVMTPFRAGAGRTVTVIVRNSADHARNFTMAIVGKELVDGPALGPGWKVHEVVGADDPRVREASSWALENHAETLRKLDDDDVLDELVKDHRETLALQADAADFAREGGMELVEANVHQGVLLGKMSRPRRRGLLDRLLRRA